MFFLFLDFCIVILHRCLLDISAGKQADTETGVSTGFYCCSSEIEFQMDYDSSVDAVRRQSSIDLSSRFISHFSTSYLLDNQFCFPCAALCACVMQFHVCVWCHSVSCTIDACIPEEKEEETKLANSCDDENEFR